MAAMMNELCNVNEPRASVKTAYDELLRLGQQVKAAGLDSEASIDRLAELGAQWLSRMMTVKELAGFLKCSYGQARKLLLDGRIRAIKDGCFLRTRLDWVIKYVDEHTIEARCRAVRVHQRCMTM